MRASVILISVCFVGMVASFFCDDDDDCPACHFFHTPPHCHSDGHCYCGTPTECDGPGDNQNCDSSCTCEQEHNDHFHCICPEEDAVAPSSECNIDKDCPLCPFPLEPPHCHSDGHCYCGTPTECYGQNDVTSCGHDCSCEQEHGDHFHCICRE